LVVIFAERCVQRRRGRHYASCHFWRRDLSSLATVTLIRSVVLWVVSNGYTEVADALCTFHDVPAERIASLVVPIFHALYGFVATQKGHSTFERLFSFALLRVFLTVESVPAKRADLWKDQQDHPEACLMCTIPALNGFQEILDAQYERIPLIGESMATMKKADVFRTISWVAALAKCGVQGERRPETLQRIRGHMLSLLQSFLTRFFVELRLELGPTSASVAKMLGTAVALCATHVIPDLELAMLLNKSGEVVLKKEEWPAVMLYMMFLRSLFQAATPPSATFYAEISLVHLDMLIGVTEQLRRSESLLKDDRIDIEKSPHPSVVWYTVHEIVESCRRISTPGQPPIVGLGPFLRQLLDHQHECEQNQYNPAKCIATLLRTISADEIEKLMESCDTLERRMEAAYDLLAIFRRQLDALSDVSKTLGLPTTKDGAILEASEVFVQQLRVARKWVSYMRRWFFPNISQEFASAERVHVARFERMLLELEDFFCAFSLARLPFLHTARRDYFIDLSLSLADASKELCDAVEKEGKQLHFSPAFYTSFRDGHLRLSIALLNDFHVHSGQFLFEQWLRSVPCPYAGNMLIDLCLATHALFLNFSDLRYLYANFKRMHKTSTEIRERMSGTPGFREETWLPFISLLASWSRIRQIAGTNLILEADFADACARIYTFFLKQSLAEAGEAYLRELARLHTERENIVEVAAIENVIAEQRRLVGDQTAYEARMLSAVEKFVTGNDMYGALDATIRLTRWCDDKKRKAGFLHKAADLARAFEQRATGPSPARYVMVCTFGSSSGYMNGQCYIYRIYQNRREEAKILSLILNTFQDAKEANEHEILWVLDRRGVPSRMRKVEGMHVVVLPLRPIDHNRRPHTRFRVDLDETGAAVETSISALMGEVRAKAALTDEQRLIVSACKDVEFRTVDPISEESLEEPREDTAAGSFSPLPPPERTRQRSDGHSGFPDCSRRKMALFVYHAKAKTPQEPPPSSSSVNTSQRSTS